MKDEDKKQEELLEDVGAKPRGTVFLPRMPESKADLVSMTPGMTHRRRMEVFMDSMIANQKPLPPDFKFPH